MDPYREWKAEICTVSPKIGFETIVKGIFSDRSLMKASFVVACFKEAVTNDAFESSSLSMLVMVTKFFQMELTCILEEGRKGKSLS